MMMSSRPRTSNSMSGHGHGGGGDRVTSERGRYYSRYSTQPGSTRFGRATFNHQDLTFNPDEVPPSSVDARRRMKLAVQPLLLTGAKPQWNKSTYDAEHVKPCRALLRTNSEFQASRMEYNFRAEELPLLFQKSLFFEKQGKHNKFKVDQRLFLDKSLIIHADASSSSCQILSQPAATNQQQHGGIDEMTYYRSIRTAPEHKSRRFDAGAAHAQGLTLAHGQSAEDAEEATAGKPSFSALHSHGGRKVLLDTNMAMNDRVEFAVSSKLAGKEQWNVQTRVEKRDKAQEAIVQSENERIKETTLRKADAFPRISLVEREKLRIKQARDAKIALRQEQERMRPIMGL
eukprot:ANDGO_00781.mRNA.1 hypothetical protein